AFERGVTRKTIGAVGIGGGIVQRKGFVVGVGIRADIAGPAGRRGIVFVVAVVLIVGRVVKNARQVPTARAEAPRFIQSHRPVGAGGGVVTMGRAEAGGGVVPPGATNISFMRCILLLSIPPQFPRTSHGVCPGSAQAPDSSWGLPHNILN